MVNANRCSWQLGNSSYPDLSIKRSDFAQDFVFGVATAAAQIEGSSKGGGKGISVWDEFQEIPGKIFDHSNMKTSIDSYNRYMEDVTLLKDLGVDAYRFSIPWTRILPQGTLGGGVNKEGIDHYNSLIDQLLKNGIRPFVTLLHNDWPQTLQDNYGGFLDRRIVADFKDYCELCFKTYGDRVKNWITINEPLMIAKFGHDMGFAPPGRCSIRRNCPAGNSSIEPYIVTHNLLLAHGAVARLYKEKFQAQQGGEIGIVLAGQHYVPYNPISLEDKRATYRLMDFELGWYMEPLVYGRYPISMRTLVKDRLPTFTEEEKKMVQGSADFIGINYYTTRYVKSIPINLNASPVGFAEDEFGEVLVFKDGAPIGPNAGGSMFVYIYPQGLEQLMLFMKYKYQNPKIYISENGVTEQRNDTIAIVQAVKDHHRIDFVAEHLTRIRNAIAQGVNIKGYFYWCLFDDFEWVEGYLVRFGLYYVDYKNNLTRIPKESAKWYHDFIKGT
ncbi:Glyco_hydro_1 domain-containing protein [Cephalotus follicularis]|uniref:Glyco_hydro_1 domain-containing protein n=1 Tax=Cephalotus follicularis TaxID=3775 RepID=A0A1Q3D4U1_CEPFO|nr:Glyco_hydro_1 domain-containing protein [Cephalotus follicularis]